MKKNMTLCLISFLLSSLIPAYAAMASNADIAKSDAFTPIGASDDVIIRVYNLTSKSLKIEGDNHNGDAIFTDISFKPIDALRREDATIESKTNKLYYLHIPVLAAVDKAHPEIYNFIIRGAADYTSMGANQAINNYFTSEWEIALATPERPDQLIAYSVERADDSNNFSAVSFRVPCEIIFNQDTDIQHSYNQCYAIIIKDMSMINIAPPSPQNNQHSRLDINRIGGVLPI